jgi:glycerol-3-phosphate O-acyltransferase
MTIREIVIKESINSAINEDKLLKIQKNRGNEIIDRMAARMSYTKMRALGYIMHKVFKSMYEKVIINHNAFAKIKKLNEKAEGNVIY